MGETSKAKARREREGFFSHLTGKGMDVGCGLDKVTPDADEFDLYQGGREGDGTFLAGVADASYDWVYSSHCLEHLDDPREALRNWWRVLRPGGKLILYVPHRDFYEKKEAPPSRWNMEHKVFLVPDRHLGEKVLGLRQLLEESFGKNVEIVYLKECTEGHTIRDPEVHSDGEYSIECVVVKK